MTAASSTLSAPSVCSRLRVSSAFPAVSGWSNVTVTSSLILALLSNGIQSRSHHSIGVWPGSSSPVNCDVVGSSTTSQFSLDRPLGSEELRLGGRELRVVECAGLFELRELLKLR